ncbi:hypothetical protein Bequi_13860 [Brachybacterium sp. JHP9]|uniref:Uncharacterized protein n=1 Tax=Brachybacterium equifaecis TaxID=2910770 RepID=A0ABT0R3I2_9MICO|nr:hypothetical protein [Brachybacterium equifaecis]MCL6424451.1 hypothetical protein [Brachybacterium equifaecis]
MPRPLTPEARSRIAADAASRYAAGETWAQIAGDYSLSAEHVRRLARTTGIAFRKWGARPAADPAEVIRLREASATIPEIARELEVSQTAVRTALERTQGLSSTRYPLLSDARDATGAELALLTALYEACPLGQREGHRVTGSSEGRDLAEECRRIVAAGVPMQRLSVQLGRSPTWVHWLLGRHDLRPDTRTARSTSSAGRESRSGGVRPLS